MAIVRSECMRLILLKNVISQLLIQPFTLDCHENVKPTQYMFAITNQQHNWVHQFNDAHRIRKSAKMQCDEVSAAIWLWTKPCYQKCIQHYISICFTRSTSTSFPFTFLCAQILLPISCANFQRLCIESLLWDVDWDSWPHMIPYCAQAMTTIPF